jgi:acetyl esterase/lipase
MMADLNEMLQKQVLYRLPQMEQVTLQKDVHYKTVGDVTLQIDIYTPPAASGASPLPAVIFIGGDAPEHITLRLKDSGQYISWGRLVAASGMIAITTNHRSIHRPPNDWYARLPEVAGDISDLLHWTQEHGTEYGIDTQRLGIWTCSGGPPFAFYAALRERPAYLRCLVSYYGMMDLRHLLTNKDTPETVAMITEYSPITHLREHPEAIPPILISRAGPDNPKLNTGLDAFVQTAIAQNIPIDFINHPQGRHAFDVLDDTPRTQEIIRCTLEFLKSHLLMI